MAKYTSKKNNHYIQAGWTGFGWGYQKSNNINRQDNRYNKVWTFKLNDIFEDNKIVSWLSFDELFKKGYISKEINAETNFYSNFLLLDDLDTDFAKDCEDFIVSVKEIESKIFSHFNGNIYLNANPFTIEDQKKLITELKSFIALHLSRTKLSVLRTFLEIDDLFINNSNSKSKILIPRNISEKELNEFNEMFSKVDENNYFEYKKKIAHFDINLNYKEIMKKMNNFTHIKFVAHQSISKNEVLNNFFLSEVPFFNQDFLQEEHKNNYKTHFVEFLKLNYKEKIENTYVDFLNNSTFLNEIDDLFDNFIVGLLSRRVKILLTKEDSFLSNCLSDWFFEKNSNVYDEIVIQNCFSSVVCYSEDSIKNLYENIIQIEFKYFKDNYIKVNKKINNKTFEYNYKYNKFKKYIYIKFIFLDINNIEINILNRKQLNINSKYLKPLRYEKIKTTITFPIHHLKPNIFKILTHKVHKKFTISQQYELVKFIFKSKYGTITIKKNM